MSVLVALREATGKPITKLLSACVVHANIEAIKKRFPAKKMNKKAIKSEKDVASEEEDIELITQIDGGILEYVRDQMHCKTVTLEVRQQAALFQREMDRMQGW